jgi:hypothetical protein
METKKFLNRDIFATSYHSSSMRSEVSTVLGSEDKVLRVIGDMEEAEKVVIDDSDP